MASRYPNQSSSPDRFLRSSFNLKSNPNNPANDPPHSHPHIGTCLDRVKVLTNRTMSKNSTSLAHLESQPSSKSKSKYHVPNLSRINEGIESEPENSKSKPKRKSHIAESSNLNPTSDDGLIDLDLALPPPTPYSPPSYIIDDGIDYEAFDYSTDPEPAPPVSEEEKKKRQKEYEELNKNKRGITEVVWGQDIVWEYDVGTEKGREGYEFHSGWREEMERIEVERMRVEDKRRMEERKRKDEEMKREREMKRGAEGNATQ